MPPAATITISIITMNTTMTDASLFSGGVDISSAEKQNNNKKININLVGI